MTRLLLSISAATLIGMEVIFLLLPSERELPAGHRAEHPLVEADQGRAWEHRLRNYRRARARIELNERLSPEERRNAIEQLQADYFTEQERARLWWHERNRQHRQVDL